jgi:gliding motility-associated-like protein
VVKTALFRISCLALLSVYCRAQTVTPLIITTTHTVFCHNTAIPFEILGGDSLSKISYSMIPVSSWTISPVSKGDKFTVTFGTTGSFTLFVNASDPSGAARTGSVVLTVYRKAQASFNASLLTQGFPNQLQLTDYSENSKRLLWNFNDGYTDTLEVVHRDYSASGSNSVQLIAYGQNGCNDTSAYQFYISDSSGVTLPNVFTPNQDGVNDVYRPIARGILHLSARIYSRDRNLLHSWDTVNGFWDGYTTSGLPCTDGVYFVVVEAVGFDNKKYNLSSTIQLLR